MTVRELNSILEQAYPPELAMEQDNVGILVGSTGTELTGVELALDVTDEVIDSALAHGANCIVTHHPVIFRPIGRVDGQSLVYRLAQEGLAVISHHTNMDTAQGGTNEVLAEIIGVKNLQILPGGITRIGNLEKAVEPGAFAAHVKEKLGAPCVRFTSSGKPVHRVALCSGAGGDFLGEAVGAKADAFVTGEVKFSDFLWAKHAGITLVAAGHYATENPVMQAVQKWLINSGVENTYLTDTRDVEEYI